MKHRLSRVLFVAVLLGSALIGMAGSAPVARAWAPAGSAAIHPGVQTVTDGAQCTANFVFTAPGPGYTRVFLGQAAHCAGLGGPTDTNGCLTESKPLGTQVQVQGASRKGWLAYSSWLTMKQRGESHPLTCQYNDFALVEVNGADIGKVNPSIPFWGGPKGINTSGNPMLSTVYSYGNSSLRFGLTPLSPKVGVSLGTFAGGWAHQVYTVTPGIPGDSGSALLDSAGRATGVAATISPLTTNNYTDLKLALWYAGFAGMFVNLANGTTGFSGLL